jgi:FtsP/CotA-like multicopper oxidase with cupredoxin domain
MNQNERPEVAVNEPEQAASALIGRRTMLRGMAALALGTAAGGAMLTRGSTAAAGVVASTAVPALVPAQAPEQVLHLAATDGWVSMPTSAPPIGSFWPDPLAPPPYNVYAFGFRNVTTISPDTLTSAVMDIKNQAQISAPILSFAQWNGKTEPGQSNAIRITLSNLGLKQRPDLVDGHTIHWHGFQNAIPLFDGVPELSISVPIGRSSTYYYRPQDPGTYMYHCHFEDVEHVQMGMTGMVFVRPTRNVEAVGSTPRQYFAYDHVSTRYDHEFTFMLTELWAEGHFRDAHIQTTDWTDYKPSFWLMNGRAYPDTIAPNKNPLTAVGDRLRYNPISSLVSCIAGDKVLLRLSNLGYQHHAITLDGIPMTVIAKDASALVDSSVNLTYDTNTVEIGPGESRDVLFTAPANGDTNAPKVFRLYDRNYAYLANSSGSGYGGQMTEVRVFNAADPNRPSLQTTPNT